MERDHAYFTDWQGTAPRFHLRIADVSDPVAPALVGSIAIPHQAFGIAVDEGIAYLALRQHGLHVVDVSRPAAPFSIGTWTGSVRVEGVAAAGGFVYLSAANAGLFVLDVSNPEAPVAVAFDPDRRAVHVLLAGSRLVTSGPGAIYDVSDPTSPVRLGGGASYAKPVALEGDHLYLLENFSYYVSEVDQIYDSWLDVVDVADPTHPREVGRLTIARGTSGTTSVVDAVLRSNRLYVSGGRGLYVVDVTDPTAPAIAHRVRTSSAPGHLAPAGDRILASSYRGLEVYDVEHDELPHWVGDDSGSVIAYDVAASGSRVYTVSRCSLEHERIWKFGTTLRTYELGGTAGLDLLAQASYGYGHYGGFPLELGRDLEISGGDLYSSRPGLHRFPLDGSGSRPGDPVPVPGLDRANDSEPLGPDRLAVGNGDGLYVLDTSPAGAPVLLAANTDHSVGRLAVDGELACALEWTGSEATLHAIDVGDPSAPRFGGEIDLGRFGGSRGWVPWVALQGSLAAAAPEERGDVRLIDISNPERPLGVSAFPVPGGTHGATISGHVLYVATGLGCLAVDVRDPRRPVVIGRASTDASRSVLRRGRFLLACEGARLSALPRDRREARVPSPAPSDHFDLVIGPNPFRTRVTAQYRRPPGTPVVAEVFDARGRLVRRLVTAPGPADRGVRTWDGRTASGIRAAAGVYFLRVDVGGRRTVEKVVRVR